MTQNCTHRSSLFFLSSSTIQAYKFSLINWRNLCNRRFFLCHNVANTLLGLTKVPELEPWPFTNLSLSVFLCTVVCCWLQSFTNLIKRHNSHIFLWEILFYLFHSLFLSFFSLFKQDFRCSPPPWTRRCTKAWPLEVAPPLPARGICRSLSGRARTSTRGPAGSPRRHERSARSTQTARIEIEPPRNGWRGKKLKNEKLRNLRGGVGVRDNINNFYRVAKKSSNVMTEQKFELF